MGFYTLESGAVLPALLLNKSSSVDPYADNHLYTDPLDPPMLPVFELEASGDTLISSISGGIKLPGLSLSSRAGSTATGDLPVPTLSAEVSFTRPMNLDKRLPALTISARTGIVCGTLKLPTIEASISVTGDLVGRLDRSIPGLTVSATGSGGLVGSLDKDLPPLSLSISMTGSVSGSLSKNLPAFKISSTGSLNDYGTLNADLPSLIISAGEGHGSTITLDAEISTLLMQIVGAGAGGGAGSGSAASNASRFTDYVLRHAR